MEGGSAELEQEGSRVALNLACPGSMQGLPP